MVHFVGAGPGAPDLITLRGAALLREADVIIYAGSLVNPALLDMAKAGCRIHNSAEMTLEQVLAAAYLPAMGTPAAAFDSLCTAQVLRGLRLRRRADGITGTVEKYDLDGILSEHTWGAMESVVTWDLETEELVISSGTAFAGDIMVMG